MKKAFKEAALAFLACALGVAMFSVAVGIVCFVAMAAVMAGKAYGFFAAVATGGLLTSLIIGIVVFVQECFKEAMKNEKG